MAAESGLTRPWLEKSTRTGLGAEHFLCGNELYCTFRLIVLDRCCCLPVQVFQEAENRMHAQLGVLMHCMEGKW